MKTRNQRDREQAVEAAERIIGDTTCFARSMTETTITPKVTLGHGYQPLTRSGGQLTAEGLNQYIDAHRRTKRSLDAARAELMSAGPILRDQLREEISYHEQELAKKEEVLQEVLDLEAMAF